MTKNRADYGVSASDEGKTHENHEGQFQNIGSRTWIARCILRCVGGTFPDFTNLVTETCGDFLKSFGE